MSQEGMTGGWSKHGGARHSPIKKQLLGPWACQSCGRTMPEEMTPYLYEWFEDEWIRVCAVCFNNECKTLWQRRKHS